MAQVLKGWIVLGREEGQVEWQLVDDPRTEAFRKNVEDEDVKKLTSVVFWDKDLAKTVLEETRTYATEHNINWELRLGSLWCEVGPTVGRS